MNVANLLLRITGDNQDAKRALREVATEMREFATKEAEARIRIGGYAEAKEELDRLETALTLIGQRDVTAKVKVKIDKDRAALTALRAELEHALSGGAGARPLESILGDIGALGADVGKLGEQFAAIGGKAAGFFSTLNQQGGELAGSVLKSIGQGILSIVTTMITWAAILAVLLPLINALVAVLGALIASLAAAAAGAGALLVALGGALLPVVGVLIAAFTRMAQIIKAVSQDKKDQQQQTQALAQAEKEHAAAVQANADAQRNVQEQLTNAIKAQRDAVDQLHSAQLAQQESVLGIADANLRLEKAKQNLKDLKSAALDAGGPFADLFKRFEDVNFRPGADLIARIGRLSPQTSDQFDIKSAMLELAHAQLGVKEAKQQSIEASHRLADAQQNENKFARDGVRAYQPYVDALRQAKTAEDNLAQSTQKVADTQDQRHKALKGFSETEIKFGRALLDLWNQIKRTFSSVTQPVFEGILKFVQALVDVLKDPAIHSALNDIGDAIGYVFEQFAKMIRRRDIRTIFADLARDGARLTRIIGGRVFTDLARILLNIARAAAPPLIQLFRRFADWLDNLANATDNAGRLRGHIGSLVRSFREWIGVARSVARLVLAFFRDAKGPGDSLAHSIRRQLDHWTEILNQRGGRQAVIDWIKNARDWIRNDLIPALQDAYKVLKAIMDAANWVIKNASAIHYAVTGGKSEKEHVLQRDQDTLDVFNSLAKRLSNTRDPDARRRLIQAMNNIQQANPDIDFGRIPRRAWGGIIPGLGGFGDNGLVAAEGGEYMIRRSIVQSIGVRALDMLNAGIPFAQVAAAGGHGGQQFNIDKVVLPPAVGGGEMDARSTAVMFAREVGRRGGGSG